jgi:hypothetical protein
MAVTNFNFNNDKAYDNEYNLFRDTTAEVINLYGIQIKYLLTEKINQDTVFGESSHIKIDNDSVFEFYAMPGSTDMFEGDSNIFSKFGMQNMDSIDIFVSRKDFEEIHPEITNKDGRLTVNKNPIGNLVVLGSNKIMEVQNFTLSSSEFGNNNIFTTDRAKNVYKLSLKSYIANSDDYSKADDITESDTFDYEDFGNLEQMFNTDSESAKEIEHLSQDVLMQDEVLYPDETRTKAVRDKKAEQNVFGDFG